jgi:hypothetical protein
MSGKHLEVNMTRTLCAMAVTLFAASGTYAQDAADSTLTTRAYQSKFFSMFNAFELFYASTPIEHRWCAAQSLADFPWHETFLTAFRRGIHRIEEHNLESAQYSGEDDFERSFALLHEVANTLENGACEYRVMFAVDQSVRDKLSSDEQQELAQWLPVVHAPVAAVSPPSAPAPVPSQAPPPRPNVVPAAKAQVPTPRLGPVKHAAAHPTAPKASTAPVKKSATIAPATAATLSKPRPASVPKAGAATLSKPRPASVPKAGAATLSKPGPASVPKSGVRTEEKYGF